MAQVKINHLYKRYSPDTPLAVDDVSLEIQDGEFLVLLGPSGCGKTTTLRCVAGLETQSDGDIYIGERLVNGLAAGERDIAFVFQFYALYPHLSAYDNIAFPLRAQKLKKDEVDQRVNEIAHLLQIEPILKRRPTSLPSGEQQRVALGRAMVRRPQVFLMDEPLTNLDAALRTDMRAELKQLQAELATTMIYVTHDQTEALSMAHRIAIMNLGVLQQVGTPLEVYNHPQTLFVAGFIGTPPMNFVTGTFSTGQFVSESNDFRLADAHTAAIAQQANSNNAIFGVRSEDITLTTTPTDGVVQGNISLREMLGDEIVYTVDMGQTRLRAKTEPTFLLNPGDNVGLNFNPDRIHFFDVDSEQVITL